MAVRAYANGIRYICLSTDEKPAVAQTGAILFETDTKRKYIFSGTEWVLQKQRTYQWTNLEIAQGSFFSADISVSGFDLATGFAAATGNVQISFRAASPSGGDYAWDPLGAMNAASMRASCQAHVTGMEKIKVVVANSSQETVFASIYVYLGKI